MKNTVILFFSSLFVYVVVSVFNMSPYNPNSVEAASQDIVISEIQISGVTANDEFVELYNPTMQSVDLTGWRLSKRPTSATSSITSLVSNMSGSIQPKSYFLIANPSFTGSNTPDLYYSATTSGIAANNTVILYRDNGITIVDKVGMGTAEDVEGTATVVPGSGTSIERKAHTLATEITMGTGGQDEFLGNGFDSDTNGNDFVLRQISQPQNSVSPSEPVTIITPSPTITVTPTNTPGITSTPTTTPSVTDSPTNTPTPTIPITQTMTPTLQPTHLPTPTVVITPTPTIDMTPTPKIKEYFFPSIRIACTWTYKPKRMGWGFILWIPKIECSKSSL